jgi:hypothetical protein
MKNANNTIPVTFRFFKDNNRTFIGIIRLKKFGGALVPQIHFSIIVSQKLFFHPLPSIKNVLIGRQVKFKNK